MFKGTAHQLKITFFSIALVTSLNLIGQSTVKEYNVTQRISISAFLGAQPGFNTTIRNAHFEVASPIPPTSSRPKRYSKSRIVSNLEVAYWLSKRHGVALNYSRFNSVNVSGNLINDSGNRILIGMDARAKVYTVFYVFNAPNTRLNLFAGPSFNRVKFQNQMIGFAGSTNSSIKLGIASGVSYKIINRKHFFIDVRSTYFWEPGFDQKIVLQENKSLGPSHTQVEFLNMQEQSIQPSGLNWGFSIGFKL
jgi:hypothetical protein